jgi:hypothetical protein
VFYNALLTILERASNRAPINDTNTFFAMTVSGLKQLSQSVISRAQEPEPVTTNIPEPKPVTINIPEPESVTTNIPEPEPIPSNTNRSFFDRIRSALKFEWKNLKVPFNQSPDEQKKEYKANKSYINFVQLLHFSAVITTFAYLGYLWFKIQNYKTSLFK